MDQKNRRLEKAGVASPDDGRLVFGEGAAEAAKTEQGFGLHTSVRDNGRRAVRARSHHPLDAGQRLHTLLQQITCSQRSREHGYEA